MPVSMSMSMSMSASMSVRPFEASKRPFAGKTEVPYVRAGSRRRPFQHFKTDFGTNAKSRLCERAHAYGTSRLIRAFKKRPGNMELRL